MKCHRRKAMLFMGTDPQNSGIEAVSGNYRDQENLAQFQKQRWEEPFCNDAGTSH
jgi:hypothetical protein